MAGPQQGTYQPCDVPKAERRINTMLNRYEKLVSQAEEIAVSLNSLIDRTIGSRPSTKDQIGKVPVPINGTLCHLEGIECQLRNILEHIRSELNELENAL